VSISPVAATFRETLADHDPSHGRPARDPDS
jgi:hypothetical protein